MRLFEKVGILCGLVYAAWLNFSDPMYAYLAGAGSLPAIIISISAGLFAIACAVYLIWTSLRRTGYGSWD